MVMSISNAPVRGWTDLVKKCFLHHPISKNLCTPQQAHYPARVDLKDDRTGQNKHELLQYSVRTINNSKVSRITYPRKMHALYEKRV